MAQSARSRGNSAVEEVALWLLAALALATVTALGGAQLAALVGHGQLLPIGMSDAAQAVFDLPAAARQPSRAWPPAARALIPGPALYWACTVVVAGVMVALVAAGYHLVTGIRVGTERRRRLGVDPRAHLARRRDLSPLIVGGPQPGRLILGRVGGRLVATESRGASGRGRSRQGDRSAVAIIGPTRCGKTASMVSAVLEWEGPAILSSVKDDVLTATLARRRGLGEVRVFDPTGLTGEPCAAWSLLAGAATPTGAQKAARALVAALSHPGGRRNDDEFFSDLGAQLLWALFYTAATSGATMADVVAWVLSRDRPTPVGRGEVATRLDRQVSGDDAQRGEWAGQALNALAGVWENDPRTTSSIYVTAQRMVGVWQDPMVVASAGRCELSLDWLVSGANTLYVCSPLNEQDRLGVLFGGLLSDLIQGQAYEWAAKRSRPLPDLLVVLDEAANTPTRWLPNVASTCSGLGILLVTIWQSKAQIDAAYGTLADVVLTNHGTKVIFSGVSDPSTLEYASRLLGDEEVRQQGLSVDAHGARSTNESTTRVRLLPPDILRQVPPGQALLIHGTLPPAHLRARPWYGDRRLRALARDPTTAQREADASTASG